MSDDDAQYRLLCERIASLEQAVSALARADEILRRAGADDEYSRIVPVRRPVRLHRHLRVVPVVLAIVACVAACSLRAQVEAHGPAHRVTHAMLRGD